MCCAYFRLAKIAVDVTKRWENEVKSIETKLLHNEFISRYLYISMISHFIKITMNVQLNKF